MNDAGIRRMRSAGTTRTLRYMRALAARSHSTLYGRDPEVNRLWLYYDPPSCVS